MSLSLLTYVALAPRHNKRLVLTRRFAPPTSSSLPLQNFCLCLKDNDTEKSNATLQALILSYPFLKEIILADTSETDSDYDDTTASLGESSDSEASVGLRSLLYSDDERLSTSFAEGSKISFK